MWQQRKIASMINIKTKAKNFIRFGGILLLVISMGCSGTKKELPPLDLGESQPQPIENTTPEPVETQPQSLPKPQEKPTVPLSLNTVYFDYDQSELRGDTYRALEDNLVVLKAYPEVNILLEGHCDERGTVEYNLALGDRRANAVRSFLLSRGIIGNRIQTVSYGKERPLDTGQTEAAYAKNRRVEFVIRK